MRFSKFKSWVAGLCVLALVGCGGGGASGTSTTGSGAGDPILGGAIVTPAATALVLTLSAPTVPNDGKATVTATAIALDARNNALAGVPITISADTGVVTPAATKTNSDGTLSAEISIGSNAATRVITVTASSGSVEPKTATLQVVASGAVTGVKPSDLLISLSQVSIPNDRSQTVTVTAITLDQQRNVLAGVPVTFAVNNGATITPAGPVTTATGTLTAVVSIGTDTSNRDITITASAGDLQPRTKVLPVVATVGTSRPAAADLSLVLSSNTLDNTTAASVTATATAVDANRNTLAGIPVTFTIVDLNGILTPASTVTDANGSVSATVRVGSDLTNRVIRVSASSGGIERTKPITVRGATLTASLSPVVTAGVAGNRISYKLVDVNAQPMADQEISVSAPGLEARRGTTDINGSYDFLFTAPTEPGEITITALAAGASRDTKVSVVSAGSGGVPVVAETDRPRGYSLSVTPSVVAVNSVGSSANQAQLRALFVGPDNRPVPNIRVRFDLDGNATSTDGKVSQVGTFAYSDAAGVARGTFTPGQIGSPTDAVTVRACWDLADFATDACPNAIPAKLTVSAEALSVAIGTNNLVERGAQRLTYIKKFVVMVVDSAGQAKPGATITPVVDLPRFYKGFYEWGGLVWEQRPTLTADQNYTWSASNRSWTQGPLTGTPSCPNEDVNRNAVREAPTFSSATTPQLAGRQEDLNWNGELDPRKAYVAIRMVGGATTDANGLAYLQIEYPTNVATWIDALITVTASGIGGSEGKGTYNITLPGASEDQGDQKVPPPYVVSPLGRSGTCQDTQ